MEMMELIYQTHVDAGGDAQDMEIKSHNGGGHATNLSL